MGRRRRIAIRAALGVAALALAGAAFALPGATRPPGKLRLGQSIVAWGGDSGVRMRFTLLGYVDPVLRSPWYRPAKGTRFVAFRLRITNLSRSRWQGTLASWAELVDTSGWAHDVLSSVMQPWPVLAPTLNGGTTISGHKTHVGYLGWVLPKGMKLKEFRYTFEGGLVSATWLLPR